MITKTITFEDFDGNQITKKFAFHLTRADFLEIQAIVGDLQGEMQKAQEASDAVRLIDIIRTITRIAYGEKTVDDRFVKFAKDGHRLGDDFVVSEAYSELLSEFMNNENALGEFVKGVLPISVIKQLETVVAEKPEDYPEEMVSMLKK